jgi:hypothetical protein
MASMSLEFIKPFDAIDQARPLPEPGGGSEEAPTPSEGVDAPGGTPLTVNAIGGAADCTSGVKLTLSMACVLSR